MKRYSRTTAQIPAFRAHNLLHGGYCHEAHEKMFRKPTKTLTQSLLFSFCTIFAIITMIINIIAIVIIVIVTVAVILAGVCSSGKQQLTPKHAICAPGPPAPGSRVNFAGKAEEELGLKAGGVRVV